MVVASFGEEQEGKWLQTSPGAAVGWAAAEHLRVLGWAQLWAMLPSQGLPGCILLTTPPGHKTQPFPPASFPGFVRFCPKLRLGKKKAPSITLCSVGGFRDGLTSWQGDGEALLQQENTNAGSQSRDGGGGRAGDAPQGQSTGLLAVPH